ncbi:unnamed protein product [Caenorhabditis bovis]|uniref:TEA domain-containing protein n=1 Tax=Caenorhabditis bovis TaxID=2654633 RepID=A0A8S1EZK2_9PELO|nr:unnamed protein product [Caenorhabditis bovis]
MSEDVAVSSTLLNGNRATAATTSSFGSIKTDWQMPLNFNQNVTNVPNGGQMMTMSPPAGDGPGSTGSTAPEETSSASDISGDAEGVWSLDIDQAFQEALAIYPPCGRRKIIISDEGKMYGRNELIARYIKLRCGKTRTRKQVSSHIQVLARKKLRDEQAKKKENGGGATTTSTTTTTASTAITPPRSTTTPVATPVAFPIKAETSPQGATPEQLSQQLLISSLSPQLWPFPNQFSVDLARLVAPKPEPIAAEPPAAVEQPTTALVMPIASSSLSLLGFSAYVQCNSTSQRTELVKIENSLEEETIDISLFYDKFPEILRELYAKSPKKDMFFLAKCWANINVPDDIMNSQYAVDSFYQSTEKFHLKVSTMACSFGKQAVEKIEAYPPTECIGTYSFALKNSPMCDYMVKFISELKKLENIEYMNSVLENFTVLQIVTNSETNETVMVLCFVFEVSREPEPSCSVYRLSS